MQLDVWPTPARSLIYLHAWQTTSKVCDAPLFQKGPQEAWEAAD
jgi:hypothetical protein